MPLPQQWKESLTAIGGGGDQNRLNAASAAMERIWIKRCEGILSKLTVSMPLPQRWKESVSLSIYYENTMILSLFK